MKQLLISQLKRHEGFRSKPYLDTVGKLTIGYGRNLDDRGINEQEAELLLHTDIEIAIYDCKRIFPKFEFLSEIRQSVLANMAFNLGHAKLSGFKKMIDAVNRCDFYEAADEMLDSKWARQVKNRAFELSQLMRDG